jgi:hypothetical protein
VIKQLEKISDAIDAAIVAGTAVTVDGDDLVALGTAVDKFCSDLRTLEIQIALLQAGRDTGASDEDEDAVEDLDEDTEGEIVE